MTKSVVLSLTTGDIDGIGYEVSVKALLKKKLPKHQRLILWRSPHAIKKYNVLLRKHYKTEQFYNVEDALNFFRSTDRTQIVELISDENPALWVEESAQLCLEKKINALVTGPLSKGVIYSAGLKDMGHTGILARVAKSKNVFMTFLGNKFNVLCITGHIPLHSVEENLTNKKIIAALSLALELRRKLPARQARLPIGIMGLNPHASEGGLIGNFDLKLQKLLLGFKTKHSFVGPLVPDAAFLKNNWAKYSIFICLYHDQGLIPFKLVHGQDSGVHYSLGLPFVRTSVDHGTAKDIFGKDIANCNSMLDALLWAGKLVQDI